MNEVPSYWFVARTRHGMELGVRNRLESLGVPAFIPTVTQHRSRGKGTAEKPVLNCIVFLRSTKQDALDLIHYKGVKADYLFDCATHQMMVVPDKQMDDFMRVASAEDDRVMFLNYGSYLAKAGQRVKVTAGHFAGVEGVIKRIKNNKCVVVRLEGIAAVAILRFPVHSLIKL